MCFSVHRAFFNKNFKRGIRVGTAAAIKIGSNVEGNVAELAVLLNKRS